MLDYIKKHVPEFIFGTCLAGMFGGAIMAVIVTPKALAEANEETDKWDRIKAAGKHYIAPAGIMVACTVGLISVLVKKNKEISALGIAVTAGEELYSQYRSKAVEVLGKDKAREIDNKIVEERIAKTPFPETPKESFRLNGGDKFWCYDAWSGRLFLANRQLIETGLAKTNTQMAFDTYASLNEFYRLIDIDEIDAGDELGWSTETDGEITISFYSILKDDVPVLAFKFDNVPHHNYDRAFA